MLKKLLIYSTQIMYLYVCIFRYNYIYFFKIFLFINSLAFVKKILMKGKHNFIEWENTYIIWNFRVSYSCRYFNFYKLLLNMSLC